MSSPLDHFDNGKFSQPSDSLPTEFRHPALSHPEEDTALWRFVILAYLLSEDGYVRDEAKKFINWDIENNDRVRWYS